MHMLQTKQRVVKTGESFLDFKKNCSVDEFPNRFSRYLLEMGDIYYWEKGNFHVVTNNSLAKQIMRSPDFSADRGQFFISRMPNIDLRLITDFFSVVQKMMVMKDGKEHMQVRKAATDGLEDPVLEKFKTTLEKTITTLLENAFAKKEIEFVEEIAKQLPSTVLADLFSIPMEDRSDYFVWANNMTAFFGGAVAYDNQTAKEVNDSASKIRDYFRKIIAERKKKLGDDYLSYLVRSQKTYQLTDDELVSQAVMMLVAGQVTTTDQICNIMYLFASQSNLQLRLRQDPSLLANAIEECKRFDPAVTFVFRVAKKDVELSGHQILAGETVFISNHCVNRETTLEGPFKLDITRPINQHFAYGHGAHYCLGAKLGRMQMNLLFEKMLTKYPFLILNPNSETKRDHYSLSFSGFKEIHLESVV
jgi:cytochrome P450